MFVMLKNNLKMLRNARGISQLDTSTLAKLPSHRYWLIENGYRAPTGKERAAIARVLRSRVGDAFPPQPVLPPPIRPRRQRRPRSSDEAVA